MASSYVLKKIVKNFPAFLFAGSGSKIDEGCILDPSGRGAIGFSISSRQFDGQIRNKTDRQRKSDERRP